MLVYEGETLQSEDEELVYTFAKMKAGNIMLKELSLYDKYTQKEEVKKDEDHLIKTNDDMAIDTTIDVKKSEEVKEEEN